MANKELFRIKLQYFLTSGLRDARLQDFFAMTALIGF